MPSLARLFIVSSTSLIISGSSADVGSSNSITFGAIAKDRAIARRNYVIGEMRQNGYITAEEAEAARAEDLVTVQSGAIASARSQMPPRDYFTDEIRRQLSASLGDEELFTGGLTIRATVDPDLQAVAAEALRDGLEALISRSAFYDLLNLAYEKHRDGGVFLAVSSRGQEFELGSIDD